MVHVLRAGLVLELPVGEAGDPTGAVRAFGRFHRRGREAARHQVHLLDGHHVLAVRPEFGHVVDHASVDVEQTLADQVPRGRRDDRLGGRRDTEPRLVVGGTERLEVDDLPVARHRHLARGQAVGDLALGRGPQRRDVDVAAHLPSLRLSATRAPALRTIRRACPTTSTPHNAPIAIPTNAPASASVTPESTAFWSTWEFGAPVK